MRSWVPFFWESQLPALASRRFQQHRHWASLTDCFVDALGGTGKTILLNLIHSFQSLRGKQACALSLSQKLRSLC